MWLGLGAAAAPDMTEVTAWPVLSTKGGVIVSRYSLPYSAAASCRGMVPGPLMPVRVTSVTSGVLGSPVASGVDVPPPEPELHAVRANAPASRRHVTVVSRAQPCVCMWDLRCHSIESAASGAATFFLP